VFLELLNCGELSFAAGVAEEAHIVVHRVLVLHPKIVLHAGCLIPMTDKLFDAGKVMAAFLALPGVGSDCVV